jgi:predicted Zn-dependent protease
MVGRATSGHNSGSGVVSAAFGATAYGYTVHGPKWSNSSTDYRPTTAFLNQSAGYGDSLRTAVSNWNGVADTPFGIYYNSGTNFLVRVGDAPGTAGAVTTRRWYTDTSRYYWYELMVDNVNGYPFYDGTQASSLPSNYYDLKSILRHEPGHVAGLCHSGGSSTRLMFAVVTAGSIRPIDYDAATGDRWIYNRPAAGTAPEEPCIP